VPFEKLLTIPTEVQNPPTFLPFSDFYLKIFVHSFNYLILGKIYDYYRSDRCSFLSNNRTTGLEPSSQFNPEANHRPFSAILKISSNAFWPCFNSTNPNKKLI